MGAKAGIDVNEALGALGLAVELRSIKPVGMHYHIGSQITHVESYVQALDLALLLVKRIEKAHDMTLEHLTIGGGFAIPYHDRIADEPDAYFEAPHSLEGYSWVICERIEKARPDLKLYLEPGRAIAGNTAVLASRIEARKTKIVELGAGRISRQDWLMSDAGFNTILETSSCHCLPTSTEVGDVIAFFDVGDYSLECISAGNGRDQAAAYMIDEDGSREIAARRAVADFVATSTSASSSAPAVIALRRGRRVFDATSRTRAPACLPDLGPQNILLIV